MLRTTLVVALLLLAPHTARAQCANGTCPAVGDISLALSGVDAQVLGVVGSLTKGDYKATSEQALALTAQVAPDQAALLSQVSDLASALQKAMDLLAGRDAKGARDALARAGTSIDDMLKSGLLTEEQARALRADMASMESLVKAVENVLGLLQKEKWDSARSEAHNVAEDLRKKMKAGTLSQARGKPLVDLMGRLWGEADKAAKAARHSPVPAGSYVNSKYGWRIHPVYGTRKFHTGVDLPLARGTNVYATGSGKIESVGWAGGYGNQVEVRLDDGSLVSYNHLKDAAGRKKGDRVEAGDVVGHVNSTGTSTGDHLHLEVYDAKGDRQDPKKWFGL